MISLGANSVYVGCPHCGSVGQEKPKETMYCPSEECRGKWHRGAFKVLLGPRRQA